MKVAVSPIQSYSILIRVSKGEEANRLNIKTVENLIHCFFSLSCYVVLDKTLAALLTNNALFVLSNQRLHNILNIFES